MASRRKTRRRERGRSGPASTTKPRQFASLAEFLKASGISQAKFARHAATTQATISRVARGDLIPRPAVAERIAAEANIPIESFARVFYARRRQRAATEPTAAAS